MPLHPIAKTIIEQQRQLKAVKEEGNNTDMDNRLIFQPCCSRSVLAAKLSDRSKACGIKQRLSYHIGKTYLRNDVSKCRYSHRSIAKMMGHTSIASTQIYAQVTDCKISEDMDRLIAKHQKEQEMIR